jgi:hypothetical protein
MENTFKVKQPRIDTQPSSGTGMFSKIEQWLRLETYFQEGFPIHYMPKILFVLALGVLYISNTHHAERTVRKINVMQAEVEDLRADYITLKSDLMFASKQSEVAKKVKAYGLTESLTPPHKIVVKKREY